MNRREALARVVAITGTVAIGSEFFLTGCSPFGKDTNREFTPQDMALMDEIAETIIPATDTPGAKAAGVAAFMATIAQRGYNDDVFAVFRKGLARIDRNARARHGKGFMDSSPAERTALLTEADREAWNYTRDKSRTDPPHYFRLMKELTLMGYFSSEIGCTQALRYVETPGAYDGNVPYKKGDRAWVNPQRRIN
jgi:hypothetical protein